MRKPGPAEHGQCSMVFSNVRMRFTIQKGNSPLVRFIPHQGAVIQVHSFPQWGLSSFSLVVITGIGSFLCPGSLMCGILLFFNIFLLYLMPHKLYQMNYKIKTKKRNLMPHLKLHHPEKLPWSVWYMSFSFFYVYLDT